VESEVELLPATIRAEPNELIVTVSPELAATCSVTEVPLDAV
jgi:hypothetical protein